ncbi:hypothetical protein HDU98_005750 [Podochytrium sp. JEL0797]|nr:hypothetical protein HDU98_005750 [Podochytrium sp. JEL0797]
MGIFASLNHARTQLLVVSFVCFLCPGMFNALNSLSTETLATQLKYEQNAAVYACFAIMGVIAGGLNNLVGPRLLLVVGGSTYAIYAASQYSVHRSISNSESDSSVPQSVADFSVAAGATLGLGAACLWAAQGQICLTYPGEGQKGTFFAIFWVIFNLGGVIGSAVALGESWGSQSNAANDLVYLVFIALMSCGSLVALLIVHPSKVVRDDETQVECSSTSLWEEAVALLKLFANPAMLVLVCSVLMSVLR